MEQAEYQEQSSEDYEKYGLARQAAAWEDGLRTDPARRTYEWWYTDCECSNGTKVVLIFYTRQGFFTLQKPNPTVQLNLTLPDGTNITQSFSEGKGRHIRAARDKCDVSIGVNYLRYEDGCYVLHYQHEEVTYDARMKPNLPIWRPGTGHLRLGKHYFAWLVPVPSADLEAALTVNGVTIKLTGYGYHDHNWGNINMYSLLNHWYWCRARLGEYTVICSDLISVKKYGYTRYPLFMIAKGGQVLSDLGKRTKVIREDTHYHPVTGKSIDNKLTFTHSTDDGTEYKVEYLREHDIQAVLTSSLKISFFLKLFLRMQHLDPSYVRCVGKVRLTVTAPDGKQKVFEEDGLWEQMFFGTNKDAVIADAEG